ncbi:energy transducer TonB [Roseomonas sp. SSH11]|uniref:Energy transducer TonB n=1 Tax=Pararoseomonas baculiformis TaxID=2820812 RepID=A0ABS4AD05_9PROT|nr:energy transducer TonB [Pararoseomonas baculiformis]MBP0444129.1 energy transducer TonB [Pararoseomonas baculiformis]
MSLPAADPAWAYVPAAAPAWRPRRRRGRRGAWAWWVAAALHAAALAAILLDLDPERLPEPRIVEGTPLVWEGPVGAGEGAEALAPELGAAPVPDEARTGAATPSTPPPVPADSPAPEPPAPLPPAGLPAEAAPPAAPAEAPSSEPAPPAEAAPSLPLPAEPAPQPSRQPDPAPAPAYPAEPLPLPPPPTPQPPPRPSTRPSPVPPQPPAPAVPPAASPPMRSVEVPLATGGVRLGAGNLGSPGESRTVGAPQPGCEDVIGYPASERQRGVTGAVNLRLRISDDGRVVEARIIGSSGSFALDEAAQRGVRRCRFFPALRDGMPIWGSRDYRVVFRLE